MSFLRSQWSRVLLLITVFAANAAQYTFAAFYGRYFGAGELALISSNSATELAHSLRLYFNAYALLSAMLVAAIYAAVSVRTRRRAGHSKTGSFLLLAVVVWAAMTSPLTGRLSAVSPEIAVLHAQAWASASWIHRWHHQGWVRNRAPAPDHDAAKFDIVYVIGESLRADRLPGGTYARSVTPYLHSLNLPQVIFRNVTSHGDCTGRSVPYLMVAPSMPFFRTLYTQPTLFDYAKRAGFRTSFIYSNENEWREFKSAGIDNFDQHVEFTSGIDEWNYQSDHSMLQSIATSANAQGRQFVVVETYTSHWPYGERYRGCKGCRVYLPDNIGTPVPFANAYRTQIVNSYDNALIYFDQFMRLLIQSLKKPTLIILTSDHAESLGERGMWGHCSGQPEQFSVPLMFIATDSSVADAAGFSLLGASSTSPISHANVMPTLLSYLGYSSSRTGYHYAADLLHPDLSAIQNRLVLVSEIGSGIEPVEFSHVDSHGVIVWRQSVPPSP